MISGQSSSFSCQSGLFRDSIRFGGSLGPAKHKGCQKRLHGDVARQIGIARAITRGVDVGPPLMAAVMSNRTFIGRPWLH
jgi:hypothetical protein